MAEFEIRIGGNDEYISDAPMMVDSPPESDSDGTPKLCGMKRTFGDAIVGFKREDSDEY